MHINLKHGLNPHVSFPVILAGAPAVVLRATDRNARLKIRRRGAMMIVRAPLAMVFLRCA